jgi:peptide/nickel transport system substrate-binding protein
MRSDISTVQVNRRALMRGALFSTLMLAMAGGVSTHATAQDKPVVFAIATDISSTDPHRIGSSVDQIFVANVFESLTGRGPDGAVVPVLSTAYEMSADGLSYTFTLREGVKFHDGEDFTADDVVYSWQRAAHPDTKNRFAPFLVNRIADIQVVDDYHIVITLKSLSPTLLADMSTFFPIVGKDHAEAMGLDGFAAEPIGTGPFRFVSREVQTNIELAANETYWGTPPKVSAVDIRIVPDDTARVAMLMAGEADIVQNIPSFMMAQIDASPEIESLVLPVIQEHFFLFNPQSPVWDQKVREAIISAVDVQAIADTLFLGTSTPLPGFCLPDREIGCDGSIPAATFDPERAKALLAEAGYDMNRPVKLLGLAPGGAPFSKEIVEAVASYLSQVGLKTEVILMETGALRAFRAQEVKDYSQHDLMFFNYAALNNDPAQRLAFMKTGGPGSFHSIPEFDAMLAAIDAETDTAKREQLIADALKFMDDQDYVLSLWNVNAIYGKRRNIKWSPPPDVVMPMLASLERTAQ